MGPPGTQLSPGLPVKLPKSCGHSWTSLLCVCSLGDCTSEGRSPARCVCFGAAAQLPVLYATVGQVWPGTQRLLPTAQHLADI